MTCSDLVGNKHKHNLVLPELNFEIAVFYQFYTVSFRHMQHAYFALFHRVLEFHLSLQNQLPFCLDQIVLVPQAVHQIYILSL